MAAFDLPVGYKFEPTKQLLVGYFLNKRLSNQALDPCYNDVIMDFDVYSDHPSNIMALTNSKVEEDGFQHGYFFSSLKKTSKTKNGKNISRCIPTHGTWLEKAGTKTICYQNEVIGIHKYYKFHPDSESKGSMLNKYAWMMHEYSVSDNQDLVLCHITNKKKYNNKSTRARKINMIVDQPLDYEAGPSKISRVDPYTYSACIDGLLSLIPVNAGHKCADGGVNDDESLTLFDDGYKHAVEQMVAQENHEGHVNGDPVGEMAPIQAAVGELTRTTSNLDPLTQEELDNLQGLLMA